MATITYKCSNCGGGLLFDPDSQQFVCEYCMSRFTEAEMEQMERDSEAERTQERQTAFAQEETDETDAREDGEQTHTGNMAVYICPNCSAEIVTDETTAATFCYYCHNPVVLSGRLEGAFKPDKVIPFRFDKKQATEKFLAWTGKKKFVPNAFFSKNQIEKITGIYVPYWVADCDANTTLTGKGTKIRIWRSGDIEYTEQKHFHVEREADVAFRGITKKALQKETEAWVENIQPFYLNEMKEFKEAYLLGFQAEKRNVERESLEQEVLQGVKKSAEATVRNSVTGYQSVHTEYLHTNIQDIRWSYTLFPVWILTYRNKGTGIFYYAMNGQTGKISGRLPFDKRKLGIVCACITAVCMLVAAIGVL